MKIKRVYVREGRAYLELDDGMAPSIVVEEGNAVTLSSQLNGQVLIDTLWFENKEPLDWKIITISTSMKG